MPLLQAHVRRGRPPKVQPAVVEVIDLPKPEPMGTPTSRAHAWYLFGQIQVALKLGRHDEAERLLDDLSAHTGIKREAAHNG